MRRVRHTLGSYEPGEMKGRRGPSGANLSNNETADTFLGNGGFASTISAATAMAAAADTTGSTILPLGRPQYEGTGRSVCHRTSFRVSCDGGYKSVFFLEYINSKMQYPRISTAK